MPLYTVITYRRARSSYSRQAHNVKKVYRGGWKKVNQTRFARSRTAKYADVIRAPSLAAAKKRIRNHS